MNPAQKKQVRQEISLAALSGELLLEAEARASAFETQITELQTASATKVAELQAAIETERTRASAAESRLAQNTEQLSQIGSSLTSEKETTTRLQAALAQANTTLQAQRTGPQDQASWVDKIISAVSSKPTVTAAPAAAPIEPPEYEMRVVDRDLNNRPQRILLTPRKKP